MRTYSVLGTLAILAQSVAVPAHADVASDLKRMVGYTIVYVGSVRSTSERNYVEKHVLLENGWQFKLNCMTFMPMRMTEVVVFGKALPDDVIRAVPNLPKHLQFTFKMLIDREICDVTPTL